MALGPHWTEVAKLFPGRGQDDVRIRTYSPSVADKWKAFSSTVAAGVSLQVVRQLHASLMRSAATTAAPTPRTAVAAAYVDLPQKVCGFLG